MDNILSVVLLPVVGVLDLLTKIYIFGIPFYSYVLVFIVIGAFIGYIRG